MNAALLGAPEVRRPTCPRTRQVLRAQEDARVYAELQSKQRENNCRKQIGLIYLIVKLY